MTARAAEPIKVACVGDSITQGAGAKSGQSYPSQLQALLGEGYQVGNFGVSGRTLLKKGDFPYWKEKKYQAALAMEPAIVIIMLGTNDTKPQNWKHEAEFEADYKELIKSFQKLASKPRIFICRPCPAPDPGNFGINEKNVLEEIKRIEAQLIPATPRPNQRQFILRRVFCARAARSTVPCRCMRKPSLRDPLQDRS